jgi:hypothetical protein
MEMAEKSIEDRFFAFDSLRTAKLDRARGCSALTLPELLPPVGYSETEQLVTPYSSIPARGVNALASRIMSALLPLNDLPFFRFFPKTGEYPPLETQEYLESMASKLHKKLNSKNLREAIYQALQQLLVLGDALLILEDDMIFRTVRLDHYVIKRNHRGEVIEIIYLEHAAKPSKTGAMEDSYNPGVVYPTAVAKKGYDTIFNRLVWNEEAKHWEVSVEKGKEIISEGIYKVLPVIALRWQSVTNENYGRSHVEMNIGDIKSLESYTAALIEGLSASSAFWMAVDPSGITALDDISSQSNGTWVSARQQDVFAITPSSTMNPQVSLSMQAVEAMRKEVAQSFLMSGSAIPSGDRVTATAVRMIGQELEQVLGGVFSSIARDLLVPIIRRTFYLMVDNKEVDERLVSEFQDEDSGVLSVDIVTGLQALSRESDRERLMAMGEMIRNLPETAVQNFKFDEYARALITSLGFDPRNWVKSAEELEAEKEMAMADQAKMQAVNAMSTAHAQNSAVQMQQQGQPMAAEQVNEAVQQMM